MKLSVKKQIRAIHKELNQTIRYLKSQRKSSPNGYVACLYETQIEMRHRHIAYCLMRGTPIEKIETKPLTPHSDALVERFKEQYLRIQEKLEAV